LFADPAQGQAGEGNAKLRRRKIGVEMPADVLGENGIGRILSEMIVVNFDAETGGAKNAGHFVAAELPVEKEN
jgi:hypothetical protein